MQTTLFCIGNYRKTVLKTTALVLAALAISTGSVQADTVFDQPDTNFNGSVFSTGVVHPGGEAIVKGGGFKPGQEVQLLRNGHNIAKDKILTADQDGKFSTTISVPETAATGLHPVVVQVAKPSAAKVFEFKISPDINYTGAEKFTITSASLSPSVYQSAYSAATNALFVTSSVGRPPVKASTLTKLNADTLKVEASITPAADPSNEKGQVMAVYGVAVDDDAGTVWVSNTRASTVAVYKQADLALVKQFPNELVPHARDIVVDSKHHRAYASVTGSNEIAVFDTQKLEHIGTIVMKSKSREGISPMSMALDASNGKLYTVSRTSNEAVVIDLGKQEVEHVYPLPGAKAASGVAVAPEANTLFVASQATDNVLLVDLKDGKILHDVKVGAGPLNITWDAKNKLAYAVSRGGNSIAVINLDGKLVANLDGGSLPNHISTDGKGAIFALNKARGKDDKTGDRLSKISLK
ncbi:YncE family protein [Pusillimonas sp. ANT_WB101]|uniref:YncE family protein n=1 Tax=Pusillimonas sp. ANT_WB101 TaxID=2597356 RepID=UPI0011ED027F|nr:ATP-binding protein [Pusillimonas sp. ANT_WB101]KAA0890017.1 ATP-binding protein [Pusillimonas sp. ANT_WB101]